MYIYVHICTYMYIYTYPPAPCGHTAAKLISCNKYKVHKYSSIQVQVTVGKCR